MRRHYLFNQICRIYGHHSISVLFTHTLIAQSIDIRQEAFIEERRFGAAKIRRKEYMISAHCRDLRSLGFRIDHTLIQYDIGSFYNGPQINELFLLGNRITSCRQICMGDHQLLYALTISFISSTGRRIPFNSKPSNDFELVNPAKVWIVNEHLLILRCTTEDAVYVDKDFSTIVNRNPDTYMSKAEQHHRLKTPDYFKYSIREGYQYV